MHRTVLPRRAPHLAVVLAASLGCAADPSPPIVERTAQPIVGGQTATTCQWPTTVLLSGCTGTLVHPFIVTTAAHCGTGHKTATFGESNGTAARRIPIDYCKVFQKSGSDGTDFAFCKLKTPVTDLPIIPPLYGCEVDMLKVGQKVVVAGFGDNNDNNGGFGTKRWVETTINRLDTGRGAQIGGMGKAPCFGDSGGPAFVQLGDGTWRAFGIDSSGLANSCNAGDIMAMIYKAVPWIEQQSGIDITPCHDADGRWNPGPDCHGFARDPLGTGRTWATGCAEPMPSPPAATCGMPGVPGLAGDGGSSVSADAAVASDARSGDAGAKRDREVVEDTEPTPPAEDAAPAPPHRPDARAAAVEDSAPPPPDQVDAGGTVAGHVASAGCHCQVGTHGQLPPLAPLVGLALWGARRARRRR